MLLPLLPIVFRTALRLALRLVLLLLLILILLLLILLFLLSFQIFKIEFRIFMAGFFLQNLFIFFNGFFDFSAFGQRIALIVQRFGIAVFGKFAKSLFIVSGLVKRGRFPAAVLKLLRRGLIIAAAISSQPFLIVVEEKSGLRRNRTAKHKSQNQNSPAKEIQAADQRNYKQKIAEIVPVRTQVFADFELVADCLFDFTGNLLYACRTAADTDAAACGGKQLQLFGNLRRHGNHIKHIARRFGLFGLFQRQIKTFADVGSENDNAAGSVLRILKFFDRQRNGSIQPVAIGRHNIENDGRKQIFNQPQVFGYRRNQKRFAGINNQTGLNVSQKFQQIGNLELGAGQAVGRKVSGRHVGRHVQEQHDRILRRQIGNFLFLPDRAAQCQYRTDKTGKSQI